MLINNDQRLWHSFVGRLPKVTINILLLPHRSPLSFMFLLHFYPIWYLLRRLLPSNYTYNNLFLFFLALSFPHSPLSLSLSLSLSVSVSLSLFLSLPPSLFLPSFFLRA